MISDATDTVELWSPWNNYLLTANIPINDWCQVSVVRVGINFSIYINGVLMSTAQTSVIVDHSNSFDFMIGARNAYPQGYLSFFNGLIDEVRVYNRELSATEIRQLYFYNGGSPVLQLAQNAHVNKLTIDGLSNGVYRIDYSTNLSTTNWNTLNNVTLQSNPFTWSDPTSNSPSRYYRVVWPYANVP